ncbi:MAG: DUF2791 family P-loop domain-containing protein [Candidatus Methanomethylophilaceae archaeon]|jgi:hypothetical protein|nr:DUF2791 family P-loop domain-containing protein [Candidatus Methanomethylophilaceae archaeon]
MGTKVGKKSATTIVKALSSGVVPPRGAEQIAVGRRNEICAFDRDLEDAAEGIGAFRFIIGEYGSGKTFLSQLIRTHSADMGFIVMNADLTPSSRLKGSNGEGIMLYRKLISSATMKGMMDGGAIEALIQTWLSGVETRASERTGMPVQNLQIRDVETQIGLETEKISMPFSADFFRVIIKYYVRSRADRDVTDQLRWLGGECNSLKESKDKLDIGSCVKDENWYMFIRLWSEFAVMAGFKGLVLIMDQADVLLKTANSARNANYEMILAMYNDIAQGYSRHMAAYMCGTPEFLENPVTGLYSYGALRTRLEESRFEKGLDINSGPVVRTKPLTVEEQEALLLRILELHQIANEYESEITPEMVERYMLSVRSNSESVSPRILSRDFIALLNVLRAYPDKNFDGLLEGRSVETDTGQEFI